MSDTTQAGSPPRISRRTVVKGGLVAGGALWAVPVIEVLTATRADAASGTTPPTVNTLSYVALVLDCDLKADDGATLYVTVKVDGSTSGPAACITSDDKGISQDGNGETLWKDFLANNGWTNRSSTCPSDVSGTVNSDGSLSVDLGSCTLQGYMLHKGTNFWFGPADKAGALPSPVGWTESSTTTGIIFQAT